MRFIHADVPTRTLIMQTEVKSFSWTFFFLTPCNDTLSRCVLCCILIGRVGVGTLARLHAVPPR